MAIYEPTLLLSDTDREALLLLAQLALATESRDQGNIKFDAVALAPAEALRLLELLDQFVSSKLFIVGSYFTEGLANGEVWSDDRLKEIYFSWRSRRGRTRVASTQMWKEFTLRSGFATSQDAWMWPRSFDRTPLRPMALAHFVGMERRLVSTVNLHPRVSELIVKFIERALPQLKDLREGKLKLGKDSIRKFASRFVTDLSDHIKGREKEPMTRQRIIALSTIIMDTAALFATRDWTVTGTLSSMAAVVPDALNYAPPR